VREINKLLLSYTNTHCYNMPAQSSVALLSWAIFTFCLSRRRRKMYCGHARLCVCVCVCLSTAARPHYCTNPDVTWGHGRGCPLVVHYWVDLQSAHGLHCYDNITRTLVTSFHPSCDMTTWPAGDGGVLKIVHRIWQVGVAGWPVTGRRRGGVLNITASAWIAGFQW